jgi:hypothetical protein
MEIKYTREINDVELSHTFPHEDELFAYNENLEDNSDESFLEAFKESGLEKEARKSFKKSIRKKRLNGLKEINIDALCLIAVGMVNAPVIEGIVYLGVGLDLIRQARDFYKTYQVKQLVYEKLGR